MEKTFILEISNILVHLKMFQYTLVKTITISRKVFSAFSDPIKDTNCADFSNLNDKLNILLVFYLGKNVSFKKKSDMGLYIAFSQILKVPSNIYKINPYKLLESIVEII